MLKKEKKERKKRKRKELFIKLVFALTENLKKKLYAMHFLSGSMECA